jgi:tetratricopeptide (TPR) repeat protein
LEAVGLEHFLPAGHYLLGIALARLGRYERAIQAFELALSMQPGLAGAHRWLAALYGRPGGDPGKAVQHRLRYDQLLRERQESTRT